MKNRWWLILCALLLIGSVLAVPVMGQTSEEDFVITDADATAFYDTDAYTGPISVDDRYIYEYLDWNKEYPVTSVPTELVNLIQQVGDRFIYQYLDWSKGYPITPVPAELLSLLQQVGVRYIFEYLDWTTTYSMTSVPTELVTLLQQVADRIIFQYLDWNKFYSLSISTDLLLHAQQTNVAPSSFSKINPPNGAPNQPLSLTLDWEDSSAPKYEYCIDTLNDDACNTTWISTGNASYVNISGLTNGTPYYWQVRASNSYGTTYANEGDWWSFSTVPLAPGPFEKSKPQDGADNQKTRLPLEWEASSGAVSYEYCIDKVLNDDCTSPAEWVNVGLVTSVTVSKLKMGTTYEWQVRAVSSTGGITYADNDDWWEFTTKAKPSPSKITPMNGAINQSTNLLLAWEEDETALSYEYCLDTIDDGACSTTWVSTLLDTSVSLRELDPNTTYYWQVRAVSDSGYNYADDVDADFWAFTTGETTSLLELLLPLIVK